jgi:hypothetical protein
VKTPGKIFGIPRPLVVIIVVVLIYAYKFGGATSWILQARAAARKDPTLANVPIPLGDLSVSIVPGTTFSEFGFQFEVPWTARLKKHDDFAALIYVPEGELAAIMFFNPAKSPGLIKETREGLEKRGENPKAANLFLDAASDYDLERSTWYATPDQLSLFFPRRKDVFAATWLNIKSSLNQQAKTGLYSFTFGKLRGFQFGDPAKSHSVQVDAFDDQDRKFEFVFGSKPGPVFTITQAEINRVLQTLRPAPTSSDSKTTAN